MSTEKYFIRAEYFYHIGRPRWKKLFTDGPLFDDKGENKLVFECFEAAEEYLTASKNEGGLGCKMIDDGYSFAGIYYLSPWEWRRPRYRIFPLKKRVPPTEEPARNDLPAGHAQVQRNARQSLW